MVENEIGVVGAGTMGTGIALLCAKQGFRVRLFDPDEATLSGAVARMAAALGREADRGNLTGLQAEQTIGRVIPARELEAFAPCGIVIEAAPERLELKKGVFAALAGICPAEALLLTNTSSLSVTEIAAGIERPERLLGFHFFNPASVMPLVEVVLGVKSDREYKDRAWQFAEALGKTPVLVGDSPGFIVNRVARPYSNESLRVLGERVADAARIDEIMKRAGGFRMGPFELQDLIGLDVNFATTETVFNRFFHDGRFRPSPIQQRMVQANQLGRKTGEGYYEYRL